MGKMDVMAKKSGLIMAIIIVTAIVFVAIFVFVIHGSVSSARNAKSSTPNINSFRDQSKKEASDPTGQYRDLALAKDSKESEMAIKSGSSAVPGYEPPPKPVNLDGSTVTAPTAQSSIPAFATPSGLTPPATSAPTAKNQPTPEEQRVALEAEQTRAELLKKYEEERKAELDGKRKIIDDMRGPFVAEGYTPITRTYGLALASDTTSAEASSGGPVPANKTVLIKAGTHAFVSIDTAINTDVDAPVHATVLSGPGNRMTMFGKVTHNPNDTISIAFSQLNLNDGTSTAISAYAIDPATGSAAVVGSVDHKIFQRFVLPGITGGLSAYAQIAQQQSTQMNVAPLAGTSVSTGTMSPSQIGEAALAAGVGNLSGVLNSIAMSQQPAVSTEPNIGLEVVFMKEVIVNKSSLQKN